MTAALQQALQALDGVILGKPRQLRLSLACLLARGHLLLEDIPGVGKTTLAQALARVLGLQGLDPTARTVDELKKLNLPAGVDITIRI